MRLFTLFKLLSNGPYSYVVVSTVETSLFGITTQCIGITMRDSDTAAVIYKFPLLTPISFRFDVREDNGVLVQSKFV
ncbi:hypothetical protein J6590_091205 [Homalodisca vitripennis]|nr:hypothetical protein J6590_091205 [Homalodisca vitripennis]